MRMAAILLVIGFAIRLAACEHVLANSLLKFPDTELYQAYAERIFAGEEYSVGGDAAQRTPGYPAFLAVCWRILGRSDRAVLWCQAGCSTLTCWFVWRLTECVRPDSTLTANAALALAVFDPFSVVSAATQLSECVFTTLAIASLYLSWRAYGTKSGNSVARLFAAGLLAGFAVLVRPSVLPLAGIAAIVPLIYVSRLTRRGGIAFAVGLVLAISPWIVRNAQRYEAFIPTTLNVGESLYDGLNPNATGASSMEFAARPEIRQMPEVARDGHWRTEAVDFAMSNPRRVLELAAIKIVRFWSPWPNEGRFRSLAIDLATGTASTVTYLLAVAGCWRLRNRPLLLAVLLAPAVYFCGLHAIFVSSVRYRTPILPLLDVLGGIGFAGIVERNPSKE